MVVIDKTFSWSVSLKCKHNGDRRGKRKVMVVIVVVFMVVVLVLVVVVVVEGIVVGR